MPLIQLGTSRHKKATLSGKEGGRIGRFLLGRESLFKICVLLPRLTRSYWGEGSRSIFPLIQNPQSPRATGKPDHPQSTLDFLLGYGDKEQPIVPNPIRQFFRAESILMYSWKVQNIGILFDF